MRFRYYVYMPDSAGLARLRRKDKTRTVAGVKQHGQVTPGDQIYAYWEWLDAGDTVDVESSYTKEWSEDYYSFHRTWGWYFFGGGTWRLWRKKWRRHYIYRFKRTSFDENGFLKPGATYVAAWHRDECYEDKLIDSDAAKRNKWQDDFQLFGRYWSGSPDGSEDGLQSDLAKSGVGLKVSIGANGTSVLPTSKYSSYPTSHTLPDIPGFPGVSATGLGDGAPNRSDGSGEETEDESVTLQRDEETSHSKTESDVVYPDQVPTSEDGNTRLVDWDDISVSLPVLLYSLTDEFDTTVLLALDTGAGLPVKEYVAPYQVIWGSTLNRLLTYEQRGGQTFPDDARAIITFDESYEEWGRKLVEKNLAREGKVDIRYETDWYYRRDLGGPGPAPTGMGVQSWIKAGKPLANYNGVFRYQTDRVKLWIKHAE